MLPILIVDDDLQLARALEEYLERLGFTPKCCESGAAVRLAVEGAERSFEFALVDYQLGEESGIDVARWLLGRLPNLRVVLMSGYPEDTETVVEALGNRAIFLQKPFHPGDVISCLRTLSPMLAMLL